MTETTPTARPIGAEVIGAYVDALGASDRRGALRLARTLLHEGVDPGRLLVDLVCVAQDEVGRRWASGRWNVAREHAATAVSEAVVAEIAHHHEPADEPPPGGVRHVVVACVESEWHSLPARVVAEVLALAGHEVVFLGASTPPAQLAQFVHDTGPDAVALSCSVAGALPRARRMIEAAREAGTPVLVGGHGFGPDDRRARMLGAAAWAQTAAEAVRLLRDWRPTTTPPAPLTHTGVDEHAELDLRHAEVAGAVARQVSGRGLGDLDEVHESSLHLVKFLAAALLVDDPRVVDEHVAWRRQIEHSHGHAAGRLQAELTATRDALPDLPLARSILVQAAAA